MTMTASPFIPPTSALIDQDTAARVALACARLSGNVSVAIGIEAVGGAAAFVAAVHDGEDGAIPLSAVARKRIRCHATAANVARVLEVTHGGGLGVLAPNSDLWPAQLGELGYTAPLVLWTRGDATLVGSPSIALTGSSIPTAEGIHMAIELGTGLADRGWTIATASGAGVNQLALRAAEAMRGRSLLVTAASLDKVAAPPLGGAAVSEVPPLMQLSVEAQRRAKSLLAALTAKTIVIEGSESGGAQRTADVARTLGHPVGAVATSAADHLAIVGATAVASVRDAVRLH